MWSDPIDNALGQLQTFLELLNGHFAPSADHIERAKRAAQRARECRAFEQENGRLVTPEDPF